jgi:Sulfotransferase domain
VTLPNFLVIGAQRAGTTLLHEVLQAHPEVYVPHRRKEVHYFDWYWDRGADWYAAFFPPGDEAGRYRAIGEATPDYLFEPDVPERIRQTCPDCRLIVSLRNPVDRAYSWYLYARRSYDERRSFEDFIRDEPEVIARGRYSEQIKRYRAIFPDQALLTMIFEEFVVSPADHLELLTDFLRLTRGWDDPSALLRERVNNSGAPYFRRAYARARALGNVLLRHDLDWPVRVAKQLGIPQWFGSDKARPKISEATRAHLERLYADEIRDLEALLRRDLGVWRSSS